MTERTPTPEEEAMRKLIWNLTGQKLPGVDPGHWGGRQMAAKQQLEEAFKAAAEAAYRCAAGTIVRPSLWPGWACLN